MKKKFIFTIICSLVLGMPIEIDATKKESANGCSTQRYSFVSDFYQEKKNTIQVLALGDSNTYRGFSPMTYWEDKKIPTHVLATPSQPAWLSYYQLLDALSFQKPKVVVYDINGLFADFTGKTSRYCTTINSFHGDRAKLQAIHDDAGGLHKEDRDILYENYTSRVYQDTLKQILPLKEKQDDLQKEKHYKGYLLNRNILPNTTGDSYMYREVLDLSIHQKNEYYIDNMVKLCKREGITLLFVKIPTIEWSSQKSALAKSFAQERKIPFLELNESSTINWMEDTKDAGHHMNDAGAIKCTRAIEKFIDKYVHLSPTKNQEVMDSYDTTYYEYLHAK